MITAEEYRTVEARLDEALALFHARRPLLTIQDRYVLDQLMEVRKDLHELRIAQEADAVF
jgi:hypothetical protein